MDLNDINNTRSEFFEMKMWVIGALDALGIVGRNLRKMRRKRKKGDFCRHGFELECGTGKDQNKLLQVLVQ